MLLKVQYRIPDNPDISTEDTLEYLKAGLVDQMAKAIVDKIEFKIEEEHHEKTISGQIVFLEESKFDVVFGNLRSLGICTSGPLNNLVSEIRLALMND